MIRRRLDVTSSPTEMLRRLRDQAGLIALIGAWTQSHDPASDDPASDHPVGDDQAAGGPSAVLAFDPVRVLGQDADPFEAIAGSVDPHPPSDRSFGGGWIGLWGYLLGARLEDLPAPPRRPTPQPVFHLAFYDVVLRLDPIDETWWFESIAEQGRADAAYERIRDILAADDATTAAARAYACGDFTMTPSPQQHREAVAAALDHITAGDIFQANICVRLEAEFDGDPLDFFCAGVDGLHPAYAAFARIGDRAVASLSPELFLRRVGQAVRTSPIKGTAALDADVDALAASSKDRAENIMIVDLMRNDLGRVCVPGSIRAATTARPQQHSGVWHLVSDVTGTLHETATDADLLRSTFPPGSVTGAPKVRAMEVIHELEATGRELYTGAIGYVSAAAGLELSVVIRTFEFAGDSVWLGIGGGIVADSSPEAELQECLVKAAPLLAATGARLDPTLGDLRPARPSEPGGAAPRLAPAVLDDRPDPAAGLFDTMLVVDGEVIEPERHVARFVASVHFVLGGELDGRALSRHVRETASGTTGAHRLRMTTVDGIEVTTSTSPVDPRPTGPLRLTAHVVPGGLGAHKWNDRTLLSRLGDPSDRGGDVLLEDADGTLLETGRGCLFVVTDDGVHTPPLDGRILPGVTREVVLEILRGSQIPVFERPIGPADLVAAIEVFASGAIGGVRPVTAIADVGVWPVGPTTRWLARRLEDRWSGRPAPGQPSPRRHDGTSVLLLDNYDSFVYNLAQYVAELGADAVVARNDELTVDQITHMHEASDFTHLIVSPGPGTPADAGVCNDVIARLGPYVPILGVCLGHQCIGAVYGGRVVRAPQVVHGKPSLVHHDARGVFTGLDGPLVSARYHSLVVRDLPSELVATARTGAGILMGVRHRTYAVEGVQMHPESILTPHGHALVSNFLGFSPGVGGAATATTRDWLDGGDVESLRSKGV